MDGQIKLRSIDSDRDHYEEVYDVWKQRSNHLTETRQWITDQLSWLVNGHFMEISRHGTAENERVLMNSLSIGSGAGELEYAILQTLLSTFPRINHCAIEPSASLHCEYKDRIVDKPEFNDVDFTWEHRTFDSYRVRAQAVSDTAPTFDFINAFDSLYYVDDLEVAMEYLYKHLAPGGMLLIRLISDRVGFGPLWNAFPELYSKDQITSANVRDYCESHDLQSTTTYYPAVTRGTDITGCFDDEPAAEDALMLDFFTHTVNFVKEAPSKLKDDVLEFLGSDKCSETSAGGKRSFVSGAEYIVIAKK